METVTVSLASRVLIAPSARANVLLTAVATVIATTMTRAFVRWTTLARIARSQFPPTFVLLLSAQ